MSYQVEGNFVHDYQIRLNIIQFNTCHKVKCFTTFLFQKITLLSSPDGNTPPLKHQRAFYWFGNYAIEIITHFKAIELHDLTLSQLGGYHSRNTTEILGVGASFSLQAPRVQHCSIQAGLQIYGRQVTVAQKVRLQLGESDGNSADVHQHKQKMPKTDTLDALDAAMTTILTTNLDK